MTEHSQETKIAILEAKVDHMMGHVTELTKRVRANEKVVAIVSAIGIGAGGIVGTTVLNPQKAEACSPPPDGSEFVCPPHDGGDVRKSSVVLIPEETDMPHYFNNKSTLYDTRVAHKWPTAGELIDKMREYEAEKIRTPIDESINNALGDFYLEDPYGSDDPTKQEELLQLPSDGDKQGT